jgi:hypothetical protein
MKTFLIAAACLALFAASVSLAAPAKKDKVEDLGPIREEQLAESVNNLKQIGIAFHNYNDTIGVLPTNQLSNDKKPLLSWRVQILPYIEEDKLYKEFKLDEPWDSAHNKKLIDRMPKLYAPVRGKWDAGLTFYQTFSGKNGWCKPGGGNSKHVPRRNEQHVHGRRGRQTDHLDQAFGHGVRWQDIAGPWRPIRRQVSRDHGRWISKPVQEETRGRNAPPIDRPSGWKRRRCERGTRRGQIGIV